MNTRASKMRRFYLERTVDVSGVSGTGIVAEGVVFVDGVLSAAKDLPSGKVVLHWLNKIGSVGIYDSIKDAIAVHGHGGGTAFVWIDMEQEAGS
jgi:hypothetical protein